MRETKKITHKRLSSVGSKHSKIELTLRKRLSLLGYRYRLHYKKIYGKPDIVFPTKKVAIFCDSHFWHGYKFDNYLKNRLKINKKYWKEKIKRNINRDKYVTKTLRKNGWIVLRFWEHQIQNNLDSCIKKIEKYIY